MNQTKLKSINSYHWQNIRLIATDMDGTLTQGEKFDAKLLQVLTKLSAAGIDVLITTGRSAGWVQAIATYLPVVGAIAENGGLVYWNHDPQPHLISDLNVIQHRQQLQRVFQLLERKFPQIRESLDNCFRMTDWTFEVENLNPLELEQIELVCQSQGYGFTYSTIQCHIKPIYQDKAHGLNKIIPQCFPHLKATEIVTIGDSPNDESMFNQAEFPLSVGVANVVQYCDRLKYLPAYVTSQSAGEGFCELAALILGMTV
ncbi:HAD family hydrolase [Pleurocapsa sp. CCALA 161]|uniref:HAD-IIB family hydrolase n=1 Tax=Pleurocapsa sp. CCALA 161 TaxID=2107688 RepID=UPI000D082526|nr:HAD-IIB family hydrolase [Pleurocapsa sp. CCALA 161]PSB11482.1 HAD family hydrolase [Pleurocapsa sp. CCALA 161]